MHDNVFRRTVIKQFFGSEGGEFFLILPIAADKFTSSGNIFGYKYGEDVSVEN